MTDDLQTWLAYNRWADETTVASCEKLTPAAYVRQLGGGYPSVAALLAHIAAAADAWRRRLDGLPTPRLLTQDDLPTIADVSQVLRSAHDGLDAALSFRSGAELQADLVYCNTRGEEIRLPTWAVFRHIVNHASYHRGQVASYLRQLGEAPAAIDFFLWLRQQAT